MGTHAETHKATIVLLSHNNGSMLNTRNTCFMHPRRVQTNEIGVTGNKLHMRISQNGEKLPARNVQYLTQLEEMPELFILLPMPEKGRYRRIHT